jgi:DNA-binding NarL/FixJ family response regulator
MGAQIRVAVCDDARAVKMFLQQVLEDDGDIAVVSTTSTGREALDAVGRDRPDALLLDLLLPDVPDPPSFLRDMRGCSPATAIVLMSNLPAADLQREAARVGADGWTPKARKPAELRAAIRAAVAPSRA